MTRPRALLWLIALIALAFPSVGAWAAPQPAVEHAAMADCSGHEPSSPEQPASSDMAKHIAGDCCAFMCVGMALMPTDPVPPAALLAESCEAAPIKGLVGRHLTKDPPPPRA